MSIYEPHEARAQWVIDAMTRDPEMWATHGMPPDFKIDRLVELITDACSSAYFEGYGRAIKECATTQKERP